MDSMVSKERTKKTKQRHKKASRNKPVYASFLERPFVGILTAVTACLISVFRWNLNRILQSPTTLDTWLPTVGEAALLLSALFCVAIFLNIVTPELIRRNSRIVLLSILAVMTTGLSAMLRYYSTVGFIPPATAVCLLPFIFAPLLATILLNARAGLAIGFWTAIALAIQWDHSLEVFITGLTSGCVAVLLARRVRTRTKVMKIAMYAGITQIISILAIAAIHLNTPDMPPLLHKAAASIAGATLSTLLALLILPAFEHIFAITTDITLLEFSDLGHPLLQRLALEAPGTYHHSLVVANLAQAAAEAIGANGLEARVCAYFHDIGKLTKPNFFAENIHMQHNPHDDIPPSMSTLIITAHVKEGLSLAMLNNLPEPVLRAIREHHGSSMLKFFHHKAKSQLEFEMDTAESGSAENRVDESSFRYQGPKPSTKVSAIIALADPVEAASRSLEKTTPGHIEGLITDIIRSRIDDGQLDECDLTMRELSIVRRSFVFTLTNMLHSRIAYPKDEKKDENKSKHSAKQQQRESGAHKTADTVADDKGPAA